MGFLVMYVMECGNGFTWVYVIGGIYNGLCLGLENLLGLTREKRKDEKPVYIARCIIVNMLLHLIHYVYQHLHSFLRYLKDL